MKRLLLYLLIVFGFGLIFNMNTEAANYFCVHESVKSKKNIDKVSLERILKEPLAIKFQIQNSPSCYTSSGGFKKVSQSMYNSLFDYYKSRQSIARSKNNSGEEPSQTQIAKTELDQKQEESNKIFYDVAFCHPKNSKPLSATITVWANIVGENPKKKCNDNEAKFEDIYNYKELSICLGNKITNYDYIKNYFSGQVYPVSCSNSWPLTIKYDGEIFYSEKQTTIAKAETSQTQKVEEKVKVAKVEEPKQEEFKPVNKWYASAKHPKSSKLFIATKVSNELDAKKIAIQKCYEFVSKELGKIGYNDCYIDLTVDETVQGKVAEDLLNKQKVAKVEEPKQEEFKSVGCKQGNCVNGQGTYAYANGEKYVGEHRDGLPNGQGTYTFANGEKYVGEFKDNKYYGQGTHTFANGEKYVGEFKDNKYYGQGTHTWADGTKYVGEYKDNQRNGQGTLTYADGSYCTGIFENDKCLSDIVKADPNKNKPKKKVEVAKVEEPKQEEIKPKSTNQDKDPPVIQIASNITVSDTTYEIEGVVKDNSENIFVEIDGQTIQAKNGKFKLQRYSPIDHQLKIVAVDQWGNRSEPKLVDIKIELQVAKSASIIEPLNPSNLKVKADRNKVALVIGVEKYENTPSAKFASLDAKYFKDYARKAFGVHEDNINLLTDEEANFSKTTSAFFKWLPSKIKSNKTDLIIFYAGHGLASSDGKDKYILPFDADPDLLSRTAISRKEIFDLIISLKPRSVTIFLDTCYSGVSRDEQMLLASARPLRVIADDDEKLPDNFTIFSASENDQISSGLESAKHGIFSYYLMKGLEGKADLDQDGKLTNNELLTYLDNNVSEKALNLGRQQNPTLTGNPDQILARY
jgi:hypothetical protein